MVRSVENDKNPLLIVMPVKGENGMSVPGFQKFMLPILKVASDNENHVFSDTLEKVSDILGLSDEDRSQMLPSGTQTCAYNRFCWAITYMQKAGLLDKPARGSFRINERGHMVLRDGPEELSTDYLMRYPEFKEFKSPKAKACSSIKHDEENNSQETPEERLELAFEELSTELATDLLDKIKASSPRFFEHLVIDLLVAMGYGGSRADAAQVVGKTGDGGIDGTIKEDKLGLDVIYVQAKRWENVVGRKEIQAFAGSLEGERASKGVFITTSNFSAEALDFVKRIGKKIVLIDGERLAKLMIEHGVGCTEDRRYIIRRLDNDYFEEL